MSSELRRHWSVLLASGTGVMLGISAIPAYVLGVFAGPMTREFGWSLGAFQAGTLVFTAGILLSSAWIGAMCDRHGARAVALVGMPAGAIGVACLALTQAAPWTWYVLMFVASLLGSGTVPTVWTRMVNALFVERRGLALGLVLSGSGLFALFGAPLAQALIVAWGWRGAWLGVALLPLVVGTAVVAQFFRGDDRGRVEAPVQASPGTADGEGSRVAPDAGEPPPVTVPGMTHHEALRSYRFWVMALGFASVTVGVGGINANFIPMLVSKGFEASAAAGIFGTLGVAIALGRLSIGYVIDRVWAPGVAGAVLGLPAITAWLLVGGDVSRTDALLAAALLGFAQGAEYDFMAYLTARYFGMANYGRIYGRIVIPVIAATAVGAFGVGWSKDLFGSFDVALPVVGLLFVGGAVAMLTLGRYPRAYAPPVLQTGAARAATA
jgi:predicted MFS family arabinose efflux permease